MNFLDWFPDIEVRGRKLTGYYKVFFGLIAAGFSGFYLYTSGFGLVSSETNRAFYLLFTAILIFLSYPLGKNSSTGKPTIFDFILIILVTASIGYWVDQYVPYAMERVSSPNKWDTIMGIIAILVIVETSRRALGWAIPIIAFIFLLQLYYGAYLPGKLSHSGLPFTRIIEFRFST